MILVAATFSEPVFEWVKDLKPMAVSPDARGSCDARPWPRSWEGFKATKGIDDAIGTFEILMYFRILKAFKRTDGVNDACEVDETREQLRMFRGFLNYQKHQLILAEL